jgi:hypothetical protein
MSTFLISFSQTAKKDSLQLLKNQNTIINNQKIIIKNQDTIKQTRRQDTLKMTDLERKKLEYFEYQRKQQQMNKNLEKMDKNIDILDKQSIKMDSVFKKRGIK